MAATAQTIAREGAVLALSSLSAARGFLLLAERGTSVASTALLCCEFYAVARECSSTINAALESLELSCDSHAALCATWTREELAAVREDIAELEQELLADRAALSLNDARRLLQLLSSARESFLEASQRLEPLEALDTQYRDEATLGFPLEQSSSL